MTVQPVGPVDDDQDKIWQADDAAPLTEDAKQTAKDAARKLPSKPELPKPTNTHMAIIGDASVVIAKQKEIQENKAEKKILAKLEHKPSVLDDTLYGLSIDLDDEQQVVQAARNFYQLIRKGYEREAVTYFRQLPPELQENIGYRLLNADFDLEPARAGLSSLFTKNAQLSPELRQQAKEKLSMPKQNILTGALNMTLNETKKALQEATQFIGGLDILQGSPDFTQWEAALYATQDAKLIEQYEETKQFLTDMPQNISMAAGQCRKNNFADADSLAVYLDSQTRGVYNAYLGFLTALDAYTEANGGAEDFTQLRGIMQETVDRNHSRVAQTIRDIYRDTQGRVILKLNEDVYILINESLARLNEPPLSLFFCDLEPLRLSGAQDLAFLSENYEYAGQYLPQMRTALDLVLQILRVNAKEMSDWKDEQLKELRELENFFEKAQKALRDFAKRITNSEKLRRLEMTQMVMNTYARGLHELEAQIKKLSLDKTKTIGAVLAKYRVLYEDERWRVIVEALRGSSTLKNV